MLHHLTQKLIYETCDMDDLTPSYSQTVRMRKLADEGALGEDAIREIMSLTKAAIFLYAFKLCAN